MRFGLNGAPEGGVRFIRDIPDGPLIRLEGRNGIGKTVAIRLLQQVTGGQPYITMRGAWDTLRSQLGNTMEIVVSNLKGGDELRFVLTPKQWVASPAEPAGPWLGQPYLNGDAIQWSDVPSLLQVARIGGDESLQQSLSDQVRADRERLVRVLDVAAPRVTAIDARLKELSDLVRACSAATLQTAERDVLTAQAEAERAEAALIQATAELREVQRLEDLRQRANELKLRLPDLERQHQETVRRRRELEERLEALDRKRVAVLGQRRRAMELAPELERVERLLRLRLDRRATRRREAEETAHRVGITLPVHDDEVRNAVGSLRSRLSALQEERRTLDVSGLLRSVINDLQSPLSAAVNDGLGAEVIWQDRQDRHTVAELKAGLSNRDDELSQADPGEELRSVLEEMESVQRQLAAASRLPRILRLERKAVSDVEEADSKYRSLIAKAGRGTDIVELEGERRELFTSITEAVVTEADLVEKISSLKEFGTADELERKIQAAGGTVDDMAARLSAAQHGRSVAFMERDSAARALAESIEARDAAVATATKALRRLREDRTLEWVRLSRVPLPEADDDLPTQANAVEPLSIAVTTIRRRLFEMQNRGDALRNVLEELGLRLARNEQADEDVETRSAMRGAVMHYDTVFTQQFAGPELRRALFENGTDVAVDLWRMTTSWTARGVERRTRPLEAFSSGERAFAYTRVQLERVAATSAANVCVFLDEFGAYVARDRLDELMAFIRNQALGRIADKVVVILPLRTLPRGQHAKAVEEFGYYTEVLK